MEISLVNDPHPQDQIVELGADGIQYQMVSGKSIPVTISSLDIPQEVRVRALALYESTTFRGHRNDKWRYTVFSYVYHAYYELGITFDPKQLAAKTGIGYKDVSKALNQFTQDAFTKGHKAGVLVATTKQWIDTFLARLKMEECSSEVVKLHDELVAADPILGTFAKKKLAGGIVYYWVTINGITLAKEMFPEIFEYTDSVIKNFSSTVITKVHNAVPQTQR